jgi:parallel beta-helix repeat protein
MNEFLENVTGVEFESADSSIAANVIEGNLIASNFRYGILARSVAGIQITNNEVNTNGSDPEFDGGILLANTLNVSVNSNEVNESSGFGIVLDASFLTTVADNQVNKNGGAGIVLVNSAQGNQVEYNEANKNSVGVVAGIADPFPNGNFFQGNTFEKNTEIDVLDLDPVCNDIWTANSFDTAFSAAGNCVE